MLPVNEIFYSIQGESTLAGLPTVFVRLAGCNLKCAWCDTAYALDVASGISTTVEEISDKIAAYKCRYICLTGGEPLIHRQVKELINLLDYGSQVISIETNGSIRVKEFQTARTKMIMDIKCPSSKVPSAYYKAVERNLPDLEAQDEIKFVVTESDLEFVEHMLPYCPDVAVLISPVWNHVDLALLVGWLKSNRGKHPFDNVRIQLQMHKIIWHPMERGV